MAKFRKIDPRIWNDAKFMSLSDDAKLLFFFLLTHPGMTSVGAMRASLPGLAAEIGWLPKRLGERFAELFRLGLANHDETVNFLALPNWMKYNSPDNPNQVKAWAGAFDLLPECDARDCLLRDLERLAERLGEPFAKGFAERLPKPGDWRLETGDRKKEQEQEDKPLSAEADGGDALPISVSDFISSWNPTAEAHGLALVRKWTPERRKKLLIRLLSPGWYDLYQEAIEKLPLPESNGSTWQPDLDWLVANGANVLKVVEGKYDFRAGETHEHVELM